MFLIGREDEGENAAKKPRQQRGAKSKRKSGKAHSQFGVYLSANVWSCMFRLDLLRRPDPFDLPAIFNLWKTSFHPRILALHCLALFFRSFFALLARDARCYCQRLPFKILCEASFSPPLKRKILFLPNHIEFFICSFALRCVLSLWPVCFKLRQTIATGDSRSF